jgi:hypothetical protein
MWVDFKNHPNRKHTINKEICGPHEGETVSLVCQEKGNGKWKRFRTQTEWKYPEWLQATLHGNNICSKVSVSHSLPTRFLNNTAVPEFGTSSISLFRCQWARRLFVGRPETEWLSENEFHENVTSAQTWSLSQLYRFSRRWILRLGYYGTWRRVVWSMDVNSLERSDTSFVREEEVEEDGNSKFLRTVCAYLPDCRASHPRRPSIYICNRTDECPEPSRHASLPQIHSADVLRNLLSFDPISL